MGLYMTPYDRAWDMGSYTEYMWVYDGICQVVRIPDDASSAEHHRDHIKHLLHAKRRSRIKKSNSQKRSISKRFILKMKIIPTIVVNCCVWLSMCQWFLKKLLAH